MPVNSGWANNCGIELFTIGWVKCPEAEERPSGGWEWFENEYYLREAERAARKKKRKKAKKIKDKLIRAIAIAERDIEDEDARQNELRRLVRIVEENRLHMIFDARLDKIIQEAIDRQTYSTMERMERELTRYKEQEEQFLLIAAEILFELL